MIAPELVLGLPKGETQAAWPVQGQWTYEDYLRLPDDGQEYVLLGQFAFSETLHSNILTGLGLSVQNLFLTLK